MNRRYKRIHDSYNIKDKILFHIKNNLKEYLIVSIIFIIGILIGVLFINNTSGERKTEITSYITSIIADIKDNNSIDEIELLMESIRKNLLLAILLWFMGSTIIGIVVVYLIICFRGFCLGYTISSIILSIGTRKRNTIFNIVYITTKHFIYTCYNRNRC